MSSGPRSASPGPAPGRPPGWLAPAAALALPCLPFLPLLLAGETLWFRDFSLYFVPMKALLVELWRSGELPLWDPHLRNGLPFLANPQTGVLYPPSLVLVALGLEPGLALFLLLHLAAAGGGFYLLLRSARFAPAAALFGALAFAGGGYVASLLNVLNNLQAAAWVPWLLAFALRLARGRAPADWFGLVAATALALLGGELQLAALGLGLAAVLVLAVSPDLLEDPERSAPVRAASAGAGPGSASSRLAAVGLVVLAALAAAALAAVQLLPTAELLGESVRRGGLPFALASEDSLQPSSLFSLAFPRPAIPGDAATGPAVGEIPWLLSAYLGVAVVCLACLGSTGPRRRWTVFWWAAAALGVALALGSHSVVFRAAFEVLPPLRSIRFPEKFLLLTALAVPALGAAGVERLLERRIPVPALVAGAALVLASGAGSWIWMTDGVRATPGVAALAGGAVLAATLGTLLAAVRGRLDPGSAARLLCAIAVLDLGWQARAVNPSVPWRFYERPWAARVLEGERQDPPGYRIRSTPLVADMEQVALVARARFFSNHYFFQQSLAPNLGELYGFLHQDGMAGIETRGTAEQIDALVAHDPAAALRLLRLQAVRYLVTSFPLPASEVVPVAAHPELPVAVVRVRGALPRAYLASRWMVEPDVRAATGRMLEASFVPGEDVVLERVPFAGRSVAAALPRAEPPRTAGAEASRGASSPGAIRRVGWEASRSRFELDLERSAILVVTDTWFPGWVGQLDGRPAPLLRANGYQQAVAVPPGRHVVQLAYRPASLVRGAWISAAAALALLGLGMARCRLRRVVGRRRGLLERAPGTLPAQAMASAQTAQTRACPVRPLLPEAEAGGPAARSRPLAGAGQGTEERS